MRNNNSLELRMFWGKLLIHIGILLFFCLFWYPNGFLLGGDAYFLGAYNPNLEVIFPYAGIGIICAFIGKYITQSTIRLSPRRALFLLAFLGIMSFSAIFSIFPEVSILWVIIWMIAFFVSVLGDTFLLDTPLKKYTLLFGICLGAIINFLSPELNISKELIAIAAILLMLDIQLTGKFKGELLATLILFFIIWDSGHFFLTALALTLWFLAPAWLPRTKKNQRKKSYFFVLFCMFCLIFWGVIKGHFNLLESSTIPFFMSTFSNIINGVGDGQYLIALAYNSTHFLLPNQLILPDWGILLTFFEKGLIGIILYFLLMLIPIFWESRNGFAITFFFFCFWLFTIDFLGTENGVLLAMVFLFAHKESLENKIKPLKY